MSTPTAVKRLDLTMVQGTTFKVVITWETTPIVYREITGVTQGAPAVITCLAHGVPDGWRVAIVGVKGMTQLNAKNTPPEEEDFIRATKVSDNQIELNEVITAGYSAYSSGGFVMYYTPALLPGFEARMSIKDRAGGTELLRLDTDNTRITLDDTLGTVLLTVSATDTAALTWTKGVYDLEMVSPAGEVTAILTGTVTVKKEVTSA